MKALSLKQPYAEIVVSCKKTIELRKWNTKFRGEFLFHASKIPDLDAMHKFGFKELPTGRIVGKTTLTNVKHYKTQLEHSKDKNLHLANEAWGNYGFILGNARRIKEIPTKGKINFWDFNEQKV
ncbi:ASCH domain-containing protein [Candidatus Pacearchaeota archaeon]|nr:ASCH domain-containing protein [Candidatus Pacearchaeota archaeon]